MFSMWDTDTVLNSLTFYYEHQAHRWAKPCQLGCAVPSSISLPVCLPVCLSGTWTPPQTADWLKGRLRDRQSGLQGDLSPAVSDLSHCLSKSDHDEEVSLIIILLCLYYPSSSLIPNVVSHTHSPILLLLSRPVSKFAMKPPSLIFPPFPNVSSVWQAFSIDWSSNCVQEYKQLVNVTGHTMTGTIFSPVLQVRERRDTV